MVWRDSGESLLGGSRDEVQPKNLWILSVLKNCILGEHLHRTFIDKVRLHSPSKQQPLLAVQIIPYYVPVTWPYCILTPHQHTHTHNLASCQKSSSSNVRCLETMSSNCDCGRSHCTQTDYNSSSRIGTMHWSHESSVTFCKALSLKWSQNCYKLLNVGHNAVNV